MFERLELAPPDPILSLIDRSRAERRPEKLDLGVGVYVNDAGSTPIMQAVRAAEVRLWTSQTTKNYVSSVGNAGFTASLGELVLGGQLAKQLGSRLQGMQTTGSVAALRLGGEAILRSGVKAIWLGDPTWPVHAPIFLSAGLRVAWHPYYSIGSNVPDFERMMESLKAAERGDAVLLHGCCHNPSGSDLSLEHWKALAGRLAERGILPFIDLAYVGLGQDVDADCAGLRAMLGAVPEAVLAVSCSKSFGLYRERVGALYFLADTERDARAALTNSVAIGRVSYSMPPDHGSAVVELILNENALRQEWQEELRAMRGRINGLRDCLAGHAEAVGLPFSYVRHQHGMFSILPLAPDVVRDLERDNAIYMAASGRINIAGLSVPGCRHLIDSISRKLQS